MGIEQRRDMLRKAIAALAAAVGGVALALLLLASPAQAAEVTTTETTVSVELPDPAGARVTEALSRIPAGTYGGVVLVFQTNISGLLQDSTIVFTRPRGFVNAFRPEGGPTTVAVSRG